MKTYNVGEERPGHHRCRIGMPQSNEVGKLGETIDDGEDDGLAANLRKTLDEVHRNVAPDVLWHRQGLEEAG